MNQPTSGRWIRRDNNLWARIWQTGDEYLEVPIERRASGRIAWTDHTHRYAHHASIHAEFERARITGERYANDFYQIKTFAEHTATWFDMLQKYSFKDELLDATGKLPTHKSLSQLHTVLLNFPLYEKHWGSIPTLELYHHFADALLLHVEAIFSGVFQQEFYYRYYQTHIPESSDVGKGSAAGELFKVIRSCLLDENGKRRKNSLRGQLF